MRKIIVVYGDNNTGKTTVIDQAYDKLLELGAECEIPRTEGPGDFEAVLSYKNMKIAFSSAGDSKAYVNERVDKYKACDILITAYNKRFATIGSVWLKNSDVIEKIEKQQASDADNKNVLDNILLRI